jgi:hypothetical protein
MRTPRQDHLCVAYIRPGCSLCDPTTVCAMAGAQPFVARNSNAHGRLGRALSRERGRRAVPCGSRAHRTDRSARHNRVRDRGLGARGDGLSGNRCSRRRGCGGRRCRRRRSGCRRCHRYRCSNRRDSGDGCRVCRRRSHRPCRQQRQRIDVTLRVACRADAEVHVRLDVIGNTARTDCADERSLGHLRAARNGDRAEVEQRRGVPRW